MLLARPHLFVWPLLARMDVGADAGAREGPRATACRLHLLMVVLGQPAWKLRVWIGDRCSVRAGSADARSRTASAPSANGCSSASPAPLRYASTPMESTARCIRCKYTDLEMLPMIDEWKPSSVRGHALLLRHSGDHAVLIAWKRPRLHPVRWLLLAACLGAALFQARHQAMFSIVAAMILPEGFRARATARPDGEEPQTPLVIAAVAGS